jgi:hypothetical protein
MFGSALFEVIIVIVFLYLLLSSICSAINEWISGLLSLRAKNLKVGIRRLLNEAGDEGFVKKIYEHPLISGLTKEGKLPSYIPARTFTLALLDIVVPVSPDDKSDVLKVLAKVDELQDGQLKKALLCIIDKTEGNIDALRKSVEDWFDDAMERVSGWYKRKMQFVILVLALAVTVGLNADTFMVANTVLQNETLRSAIVSSAEQSTQQEIPSEIKQIKEQIKELNLPLGWSCTEEDPRKAPKGFLAWLLKILGLMITTIAVSLGAPFWFDVLNKMVSLRSAGKVPETSAEKKKPGK